MTTLKTPNRDAQGRCDELLSPTHILPVEQPRLDNNIEQRPTKKKCRVNRKEHHKRRRLRRAQQQQMNNNTNYMDEHIIINDDVDNHGSQYEQIQV